jgi:hypothetical protein
LINVLFEGADETRRRMRSDHPGLGRRVVPGLCPVKQIKWEGEMNSTTLELPETLHRQLEVLARNEGVSLYHYLETRGKTCATPPGYDTDS